jgi:hypothetical protein
MSRRIPCKEEWAATAPVRNPGERAALCALALLAHRESGQVQERRLRLASAATMGVATFRRHVAALAEKERGLIAISNPRTESGDHDETIYTLVGWLRLRGVGEHEALRAQFNDESARSRRPDPAGSYFSAESGDSYAARARDGSPASSAERAISSREAELIVLSGARAERNGAESGSVCECAESTGRKRNAATRTDSAERGGRLKSGAAPGLDLLVWSDGFEQTADAAYKDESLTLRSKSQELSFTSTTSGRVAADSFDGETPTVQAAVLRRWFNTLVSVAGPGLCDPAREPRLHTTSGELIAWRNAGVDLELDAVPIVRARTARPRAQPIWGWGALREDVLAAAARRKARLKLPEIDDERPRRETGARPARPASAAERDAANAEARRRSLARVLDEFEPRSARAAGSVAGEAEPCGFDPRARSAR